MPAPPKTKLDGMQVLQHSFEEPTGEIRVKASIGGGTPTEVIIDHTNDSIRLGDGTDLFTSTTIGSKIGLDVNIINDTLTFELEGVSSPTVTNVVIAGASTEYNYTIPSNTKKFLMRARNKSKIQFSFQTGTTNTNFVSIPPGSNYTLDGMTLNTSLTIYFQSSKGGEVLEVLTWI